MKRTDLTIVTGLALFGLVLAFWFMVLSPKRDEAKELGATVEKLEASVAAQEQLASTAKAAEGEYDDNYHRLVVLGKAVPEDADTSSLLVALQAIADGANVSFDSIALEEGGGTAASAATEPAPGTPPSEPSSEAPAEGSVPAPAAGSAEATPAAQTAAAPTESSAATLPIGATVGAANLPVMPYAISFTGGFFDIADFLEGLDGLVSPGETSAGVRGRLLTIDGFSLTPVDESGSGAKSGGPNPTLSARLAVTSYLTPVEQGLAAGATPGAPPPTAPVAPVQASSTTPAPAP